MTDILNKLLKLQQAWQSQCNKSFDVNPDQLLTLASAQRRVYFWTDIFIIAVFVACGSWMAWSALSDFEDDWPWLVYSACCAWVAGYILLNRWRRRRFAAQYDDSVLAHVEWSINDLEHRMRLERFSGWWYILPIALGCMIPPAITCAMDFWKKPEIDLLFGLLFTEVLFLVMFFFIHWTMKKGGRIGHEAQRKELAALRTLRENLLKEEESK